MSDDRTDQWPPYIPDRVLNEPEAAWPVKAGRYRLVAARDCPWANRSVIVRRLLGLEKAISLGLPGPTHDEDSWTFDLDPQGVDPVLSIPRLKDAYLRRFPDYPKGITVPALVDTVSGEVVTNNFPQITEDFFFQWKEFHRTGAPNLWPQEHRAEMEEVMDRVFRDINAGVYRAGFATDQARYEKAYERLWSALDWVEERLSSRRYLMGEQITEADVRLFTTLVRFDAVYHGHFKCNRNRLTEMPALWGYARDLFQTPGFGDTVSFTQIKDHYYLVHRHINPTGIVPRGPELSGWGTDHGRDSLAGEPFGEDTAPSAPPASERISPAENPWLNAEGMVDTTLLLRL